MFDCAKLSRHKTLAVQRRFKSDTEFIYQIVVSVVKGSLTLAMGKCLWFSVKKSLSIVPFFTLKLP